MKSFQFNIEGTDYEAEISIVKKPMEESKSKNSKRWQCFDCGVKDVREGHMFGCKRFGSPILRQAENDEQAKPLLADAKAKDLCKRRDGKWVQIETLCSLGGMPWICYEIGGLRYINNGEQLNTKDRNLDIIDHHPLAPEGTDKWGEQMLLLGNVIICRASGMIHKLDAGGHVFDSKDGKMWNRDCSIADFTAHHNKYVTAWQLYEPKPAYAVGDWVQCGIMQAEIRELREILNGRQIYHMKEADGTEYDADSSAFVRKLQPSEVVVDFGCMKGRVKQYHGDQVRVYDDNNINFACVAIAFLDPATAKLVKELLEKQEGETK